MSDTRHHPGGMPVREHLPATVFGTAAVYLGVAILIVAVCEKFGGGVPGLPRFWYVNRVIWVGLGLFLIPAGIVLQAWHQPHLPVWRASRPGRRFRRIRVYSREGCHLCDEAIELLEQPQYGGYLPSVEIVDIAGQPDLESQFGLLIPVVEFDGRIRFKGRINETLLRRLIEGTEIL